MLWVPSIRVVGKQDISLGMMKNLDERRDRRKQFGFVYIPACAGTVENKLLAKTLKLLIISYNRYWSNFNMLGSLIRELTKYVILIIA